MANQTLKQALVARGLCGDEEIPALVAEHRILVGGSVATNVNRQVQPHDSIVVSPAASRFVGRGGLKLQQAFEHFALDVHGATGVDVGSATGGFSDCLLQHGATAVVAVDVGYGQLHERLRSDARILSLERTNIREVDRARLEDLLSPLPAPTFLSADLSFSSVTVYLEQFVELLGGTGDIVILCKPQFEVSHELATKRNGVILDGDERRSAIHRVVDAMADTGMSLQGVVESPILGPAGNAEFLVHARLSGGTSTVDLDQQIERSTANAGVLR